MHIALRELRDEELRDEELQEEETEAARREETVQSASPLVA